ncbi:hypothetical protein CHS0354_024130 [Potamilus streckersoni]|uniref:Tetratricopeptide repeat protein n=1 Tax=Potamilus streckersoni TaxID=2493646 RepID=A0AAE0RZH1_9BIVA|nr:hypothetical protein CHS0354_024130 [Potamilus streckersoni]
MASKKNEAIVEYQTALHYAPTQPTILFALAKSYLSINKNIEAMKQLEKAHKSDSTNEEISFALIKLYIEQSEVDDAAHVIHTLFSTHIKDKTELYNLVYSLSLLLDKQNKQEQALVLLDTYIKKYGFDQKLLFTKFDFHVKRKEYTQAIDALKMFIDNNEESPEIYQMLGESYEALSNFEKAEEAYKKAATLVPRDLKQRMALLNFYVISKKWDKFNSESNALLSSVATDRTSQLSMLYVFQKKSETDSVYQIATIQFGKLLLKLNPTELFAHLIIGETWFKRKQYDSAEVYYSRALILFSYPDNFAIIDGLSRTLSAMNRKNEAIKVVTTTLFALPKQSPPEHKANLQSFLGYLYFENNMNTESIQTIEDINADVLKKDVNVQNFSVLGLAYDRLGNFKKSELNYKKALSFDPEHATVLNNLAYLWSEQNVNLTQALELVEKALEKEPNNASFLDTKGWILFKQEKYNEAKIFIEKSLEHDSKNATVYEHLGDVLLKLGNKDAAIEIWNKTILLGGNKLHIEQKINALNDKNKTK